MRRLLPCLFLVAGAAAEDAPAPTVEAEGGTPVSEAKPRPVLRVDAEEAAALARSQSDLALAARAGAAATRAQGRERVSIIYPTLSARADYVYRGNLPERDFGPFGTVEAGREDEYTLTARADQLLWSFGRIGAALEADDALEISANADLEVTLRDVGHRARLAVAMVLLARAEAGVAAERVRQRESEIDDAQARFEAGDVARLDVREARAALIEAENQLRAARLAIRQALLELRTAVAVDSAELEVPGELERPEDLTLLIDAARTGLEHGPEVRSLGAQAVLRHSERADARGRTLPELRAYGEYGWNGEAIDDLDDQWQVGLSVIWTAYDGGADYAAMERSAQEQRRLERLRVNEVRERFRRFQDLLEQLRSLDERIAAERESVELAEANYEDARAQYRAGVITQTRVGDANLAITLARLRLARLIHAEVVAAAELRLLAE